MFKEKLPQTNREPIKPTSYSEQQYLAFQREIEVPVKLENVKIIATPILEARIKRIQRPPFVDGDVNRILDEIYLIEEELERRKKEVADKK